MRQGSNYAQTGTGGYNNLSPAYGTRDEQVPQTRMGPDSRLTRQQVDAGAWSVDIYNRPIDRDGKLIQVTNQTAGVYGSQSKTADRPVHRQKLQHAGSAQREPAQHVRAQHEPTQHVRAQHEPTQHEPTTNGRDINVQSANTAAGGFDWVQPPAASQHSSGE